MSNKERNTLFNVFYRSPNGQIEPFENILEFFFSKMKNSNKPVHITDNFNLNLLDHDICKKVQDFLTLIYEKAMLPALNKPTQVTRMTATAIDFMLTNSFIDSNFRTTIIESDVSDHFPICFIIPSLKHQSKNETFYICKRIITYEPIELFIQRLFGTDWNEIQIYKNLDEAY